jgi:hypothetical protein
MLVDAKWDVLAFGGEAPSQPQDGSSPMRDRQATSSAKVTDVTGAPISSVYRGQRAPSQARARGLAYTSEKEASVTSVTGETNQGRSD